jgi:hypothetical protein
MVVLDDDQSVIWHEREHPGVQRMVEMTGSLTTGAERRQIERESERTLRSQAPLEARVEAAVRVLTAYHHLFLRHIGKQRKGRSEWCTLDEFIAAAHLERIFPSDVVRMLREEHGHLDWPGIAMTKWTYPDWPLTDLPPVKPVGPAT